MKAVSTASSHVEIEVGINGHRTKHVVPVRRLLVDFLRDDLDLTGTHVGCEQGVCGACTILLDGQSVRSCIMLAVQADGADLTTVEGLASGGVLSPMQGAFKEHQALQCGFCTPGILITLAGANPADYADDDSLRDLLSGTLCRCTGYQHILEAVRAVWSRDLMREPTER